MNKDKTCENLLNPGESGSHPCGLPAAFLFTFEAIEGDTATEDQVYVCPACAFSWAVWATDFIEVFTIEAIPCSYPDIPDRLRRLREICGLETDDAQPDDPPEFGNMELGELEDAVRRTLAARNDLSARAKQAKEDGNTELSDKLWEAAADMHMAVQVAQINYHGALAERARDATGRLFAWPYIDNVIPTEKGE